MRLFATTLIIAPYFLFPLFPASSLFPTTSSRFARRKRPLAKPEHLKILKQGVDAWNEWRKENGGNSSVPPRGVPQRGERADMSTPLAQLVTGPGGGRVQAVEHDGHVDAYWQFLKVKTKIPGIIPDVSFPVERTQNGG